MDIEKLLQ